jgi:Holliday junction resolvase-like predicted endonuclease
MMKVMVFNLKNKLGIWGEQVAEQAYLKRGFVLVARNIYNTRGKMLGEIDLVMRSHRTLVLIEVKIRKGSKVSTAAESTSKAKRLKLLRTVRWFIRRYPAYANIQPRIDVCIIDIDKSAVNVIIIPSAVTLEY